MADNKLIDIKGLEVVYEDILTTLKENYVKNSNIQDSKEVIPSKNDQTITPDAPYSLLKQVVVKATSTDAVETQEKTISGTSIGTKGASATPDLNSGKLLSKVTVTGLPATNWSESDLRAGKTAISTSENGNTLIRGNMPIAEISAHGEGEAELGISFTNGKIKADITDGYFENSSFPGYDRVIKQGYLDEDDSTIDLSIVVSGSAEIDPKLLDSNLVPENIVYNKSVFGVNGNFSQVDSDKAAYDNDIIEGKEAFVNGVRRVGKLKKKLLAITPSNEERSFEEDGTVYHKVVVNPIPDEYTKVSETTTTIAANSISANVAYTVNNSNVTASNKVIVMPSNAASAAVWGKYGISVSSTQSAGKVILTALYNVTEAFSVDIVTIG